MGDNFFSIEVTAEDGVTKKTYNVTITRGKLIEPSAFIKSLKVNGVESKLSPEFDSKNDKYTILVPADTENLDLTYELEDPLATVSIEGNENFKIGENLVKINVTSSNNEKKQTYEILVTVEEPESTTKAVPLAPKEEKKSNKWLLIAIIIAIVCILTVVAILLFKKKKDNKDDSETETSNVDVSSSPIIENSIIEDKPLYTEEKTETYDSSLFKEQTRSDEEELDKTKEFNFKDM